MVRTGRRMRSALVSAVLVVAATAAATAAATRPVAAQVSPQDSTRWGEPAIAFVRAMSSSNWSAALALTTPAAPPGTFTVQKLEQVWQAVRNEAGSLTTFQLSRVTAQAPYRLVDFAAAFQRAALIMRVVMDDSARVTGFGFLPTQPTPAASTLPPYADSAAYTERAVQFGLPEFRLEGTLTIPRSQGPHPVVVLVHGSGPNDRDETIGPNKPFRDLAWGLASRGVAVFRFDKRTFVHSAKMSAADANLSNEVIDDALQAVQQMRTEAGIDSNRVFVLGHSLGGMLAPQISQRAPKLKGIILAAAPARVFSAVLEDQLQYLDSLAKSAGDTNNVAIAALLAQIDSMQAGHLTDTTTVMGVPVSYWKELEALDAARVSRNQQVPVLVLQGGRDYQSTMEDYRIWQSHLSPGGLGTFRSYANLNHIFVTGTGMATPAEYRLSSGHVALEVIVDIASWVSSRR